MTVAEVLVSVKVDKAEVTGVEVYFRQQQRRQRRRVATQRQQPPRVGPRTCDENKTERRTASSNEERRTHKIKWGQNS